MPAADARTVVKGYYEQGLRRAVQGDVDALHEYLADHVVRHTHSHHRHGKLGRDEQKVAIAETVSAIPDLSYHVQRYIAEGEYVTAHWRLSGKHAGRHKHRHADEPLEPTHADLEIDGISIFRVQDGKITDIWSHDDHIDALVQAGALKIQS